MGELWGAAATVDVWQHQAAMRNRMLAPATEAMFEMAGVVAGARVLDLGTGTGDTAVMAAERVGAEGSVLATDAAEGMVEAASRTIEAAGVANVTTRTMSLEAVDVEPGTFDAAIARLSLMFTRDRGRALAGVRRALREGGRFAAVVWASPALNPFHAVVLDAARANGAPPWPEPELARAYSMCDVGAVGRAFREAGFRDVTVRVVASSRAFPSADAAIASARESPAVVDAVARLDEDARARVMRAVEDLCRAFEVDGACSFPMANLVVAGSA